MEHPLGSIEDLPISCVLAPNPWELPQPSNQRECQLITTSKKGYALIVPLPDISETPLRIICLRLWIVLIKCSSQRGTIVIGRRVCAP